MGAGAACAELRLDSDGQAYSLADFIAEYGGSIVKPPREWSTAPKALFRRFPQRPAALRLPDPFCIGRQR